MTEFWKDIIGYENLYMVSNLGNVKSLDKIVNGGIYKGRKLKKHINKNGYESVALCKSGKPLTKYVHRIVAKSFIDNPFNKKEVNHINGIKHDNNIVNLEWNTASENQLHSYKIGLKSAKGEKSSFSKLNNIQVLKIRELANEGISTKEIINILKLDMRPRGIRSIITRENWSHI